MKLIQRNYSAIKPKRIQSAFNTKVPLSPHHYLSPNQSTKNNLFIHKIPFNNESKIDISKLKSEKSSHFTFKTNIKPNQIYKSNPKDKRPLSSSHIKRSGGFLTSLYGKNF